MRSGRGCLPALLIDRSPLASSLLVRLMMGSKHAAVQSAVRLRGVAWMAFLLSVWFASSIASTLINKMLMVHFPYPVTISFVHMLSSVVVDLAIVVSRGLSLRPFRLDIFWQCLPVAATINFGQQPPQHSQPAPHRTAPHNATWHTLPILRRAPAASFVRPRD